MGDRQPNDRERAKAVQGLVAAALDLGQAGGMLSGVTCGERLTAASGARPLKGITVRREAIRPGCNKSGGLSVSVQNE
jgi:hypothetical protein